MNKRWDYKKSLGAVLGSFIAGLILFAFLTNNVREKVIWQTVKDNQMIANEIKENIVNYDGLLHGIRAFISLDSQLVNDKLESYIKSLPNKENGIKQIFYIPLDNQQKPQFINMRKINSQDKDFLVQDVSLIQKDNSEDKIKAKILDTNTIIINLPIIETSNKINKTKGIIGLVLMNKIPFYNDSSSITGIYYEVLFPNTKKIIYHTDDTKAVIKDIYTDSAIKWDNIELTLRVYGNKETNILFANNIVMISILGMGITYLLIISVLVLLSSNKKAHLAAGEMLNKIKHLGWHDSLTQLYNRSKINQELDLKISSLSNTQERLFVLCIDLQGFKRINDELGHAAGDLLLQEYAARLMGQVPDIFDSVARAGGDEFLIFIDSTKLTSDNFSLQIEQIEQEIIEILKEPFVIQEQTFTIRNKIGVSVYPEHGHNAEELFKFAELAMYEAKNQEQTIFVYQSDLTKKLTLLNKMKNALSVALNNNEFYLVYQPKVMFDGTGVKKHAAEVLCRWKSATFGNVSPEIFIALAEETGEINKLGKWVMMEAVKQLSQWNAIGIDISLSINLSPKQLMNSQLPFEFNEIIKKYGINANKIALEMTENSMITDKEQSHLILNSFHDYGFKISIDDFGKGYSSLSYLKDYPISEIKMDKGFIDDIVDNKFNQILVEAILLVANKLDIDLVIEGVESYEQTIFLSKMGCEQYQGYYFSKPLNPSDLEKYIKQ